MSRRVLTDGELNLIREGIAAGVNQERAACAAAIRARAASTRVLAQRGRVTESDSEHLARCLDTLAEDIAAGLHHEGADHP